MITSVVRESSNLNYSQLLFYDLILLYDSIKLRLIAGVCGLKKKMSRLWFQKKKNALLFLSD